MAPDISGRTMEVAVDSPIQQQTNVPDSTNPDSTNYNTRVWLLVQRHSEFRLSLVYTL